jgi:hypothetical protein
VEFRGSVTGQACAAAPERKITGAGLDAEAQGIASRGRRSPGRRQFAGFAMPISPRCSVSNHRHAGAKHQPSARVSLAGSRLTLR